MPFFNDPIMSQLQARVTQHFGELPPLEAKKPAEYFEALCESIISQQLSIKVADTIFGRVKKVVNASDKLMDPQVVLDVSIETLRTAGLSNAKASYIHNIAQAWTTGLIDPKTLPSVPESEVITKLTQIKGVGNWTAEMFLIFTLGHQDIFSVGDYGLRKAIANAYDLPMTTKPSEILKLAENWQPHRSLASRILWKSLELPANN